MKDKNKRNAFIGSLVLSCTAISGVNAACSQDSCKPASIADVKNLIKNSQFAPVPGTPPEFSPVQITATRSCNITPDGNFGAQMFTLREDTISITTQITDPTDSPNYTVTCSNPTTATIKLYDVRSGAATPTTTAITYNATTGSIDPPAITANTDTLTALDPATQTTGSSGFSACLESTYVSCVLTNTATSTVWNIPVPVPYCD